MQLLYIYYTINTGSAFFIVWKKALYMCEWIYNKNVRQYRINRSLNPWKQIRAHYLCHTVLPDGRLHNQVDNAHQFYCTPNVNTCHRSDDNLRKIHRHRLNEKKTFSLICNLTVISYIFNFENQFNHVGTILR